MKKSPLSISLNGANYVSKETKLEFEKALEEGPIFNQNSETAKISTPAVDGTTESKAKSAPLVESDSRTELPKAPITMNSKVKSDSPEVHNDSDISVDQNLENYFQQQSDTLEVHRQYLEQQSEYSRTVLQLMQQQLSMASQGQSLPDSVNRHLEMFHEHQGQTLRIHEQYLIQQTSQMHSGSSSVNQTRVVQKQRPAPAPPKIQAAVQPPSPTFSTPETKTVNPTPQSQEIQNVPETVAEPGNTNINSSDLVTRVLNIVSEKTGYPTEMLEMSMDMEADLGIDSIKRVEILGSLQDQLPDLPELKAEDLAELRTLGQIVEHLQSIAGVSQSHTTVEKTTPTSSNQASSSAGINLEQTMFRIVSDKTGYPVEMLDQSMDMEADLGIDSIKRVEIMWAFQEKFPDLPQISNSEMGELRTLEQIADHLQNLSPSGESASLSPDMIQASETQEAEKKKL